MDIKLTLEVLMKVIGGLGIFLLGMKNMSEGMQAVAGDRLRKLISTVTSNRIMACMIGVFVTCIVQSSSVTTVMVVGLVNSSFMTLTQAIGVIFGANIGTTITGWILVLKIGKYGLPLLGVCALLYLFVRNERVRYTAMAIMGIGMIFFGLELMSGGFKPLRNMPAFITWFSHFQAVSYFGVLKCAAVGCILTMIVQSSSATLGITISLAEAGIIPFPTAAALVLGENIGTTITAILASLGAGTNAKRAAYSHTIFNLIGVFVVTAIFAMYIGFVTRLLGHDPGTPLMVDGEATYPHIRSGIALVHSVFNITNTLVFLPFLPLLAKLVTKLVPDRAGGDTPHLTFLDVRLVDSPAIGIEQSFEQIRRMGEHVTRMSVLLRGIIKAGDNEPPEEDIRKVFHREEILDSVQREVTEFITQILSGNVPHYVAEQGREQLRMADEYESISDYYATILKLVIKRRRNGIKYEKSMEDETLELHDRLHGYVELVNQAVSSRSADMLTEIRGQGDEITRLIKATRMRHLGGIGGEAPSAPLAIMVFNDLLSSYRRIKDHAVNIGEAAAGEK